MKSLKASKLRFISAKATNTRLMGVVGIVVKWEDEAERAIAQIFHLDYEVYGIDGFYHLTLPSDHELKSLILAVTGGLGGAFVDITFREMVYLLKTAHEVDPNSIEAHVDFDAYLETFLNWKSDLLDDEITKLYKKINPEIKSAYHAINYLLMRIVGKDIESTRVLLKNHNALDDYKELDAPYTLIKNTMTLIKEDDAIEKYKVEALIDFEHKYKLLLYEVDVEKHTHLILNFLQLDELVMSSIEAAFNLNKPEFILVSQINDEFFERRFAENNPEMMKQNYYQGNLYIEFNADNNHVAQNPYYLNGDIYAMYFFSRSGQLLISSFLKENLEMIDEMLINGHVYNESLQFICELKTDDPVVYAYINSNYETIFDYLSQN
ncbi:hypothetical protein [Fusibacter bizertensis]